MTTTEEYKPLLSMVFKIKFLRAMLVHMDINDMNLFCEVSLRIANGTAEEKDFRDLDELYRRFDATPVSKT